MSVKEIVILLTKIGLMIGGQWLFWSSVWHVFGWWGIKCIAGLFMVLLVYEWEKAESNANDS
jgi:hypothetical protein